MLDYAENVPNPGWTSFYGLKNKVKSNISEREMTELQLIVLTTKLFTRGVWHFDEEPEKSQRFSLTDNSPRDTNNKPSLVH